MDRINGETIRKAIQDARSQGIDRDVSSLLCWASELLGESLMMTTAFGKSGMVILHILKEKAPEVPVYFLDTSFHFPETIEYLETLKKTWNIRLIIQRPKLYGPEFVRKFGERLHDRDPDLCCHHNKVEPLAELIGENGRYQGWITGIRRDQSSTRSQAEPIEILDTDIVKVQPLAYWTKRQVAEYLDTHDIPLHPLFSEGYTSIGCAPCTHRVSHPSNERAGRWSGKAKTECGLHTFWKKEDDATPVPQEKKEPPTSPAQVAG